MSTTIWKRTGAFVLIGSMLAVNASAVAQQKPQDPDHPYAGSVTGMFHDQTAGENLGEYSVYLPSTIEQCVTGVMIAVPEDMTAKAFTQSLLGQAWQAVSEKYGIDSALVLDGYDAPETALTPEQSRYMKQIYQYYREALLELCTPQQAMEKIQQLYYPTASVE